MGTMGEIKFSADYVNRIKPIIKKLIPLRVLRTVKKIVSIRTNRRILTEKIMPYEKGIFPSGINLIGPIDNATGLGQSLRLIEKVVQHIDIPYSVSSYDRNKQNLALKDNYRNKVCDKLYYDINLWHVNPSEFTDMYLYFGKYSFDKRYNIAFWLWELEDFPDEWIPLMHLLDEIWTPSEYISKSIRKKTEKPVYTIPYCISAEIDLKLYGRAYFGLKEKQFLFLMMYDAKSIQERKNPEGAVEAFKKAFPQEQMNVGLVIKINSASSKELSLIRKRFEGYKNVYLLNKELDKIQVNSLIASADVFVSLHRAEGFGLVLAEAMINHIPVIATNWSANIEFMNTETSCLVGYKMKTLKKDIYPYKKGNRWAEPDIEEASGYMKRLFMDKNYYKKIAEGGCKYVHEKLGMKRIQRMMEKHLYDIWESD